MYDYETVCTILRLLSHSHKFVMRKLWPILTPFNGAIVEHTFCYPEPQLDFLVLCLVGSVGITFETQHLLVVVKSPLKLWPRTNRGWKGQQSILVSFLLSVCQDFISCRGLQNHHNISSRSLLNIQEFSTIHIQSDFQLRDSLYRYIL